MVHNYWARSGAPFAPGVSEAIFDLAGTLSAHVVLPPSLSPTPLSFPSPVLVPDGTQAPL